MVSAWCNFKLAIVIFAATLFYIHCQSHFVELHCWLPAKVMYAENSTKRFSWLTCSTSILSMKNVQIHISFCHINALPMLLIGHLYGILFFTK